MTVVYSVLESQLGQLFVAETRTGLTFVHLGEDGLSHLTSHAHRWYKGQQIVPSVVDSAFPILNYLEGENVSFEFPLDIQGTEFQKSVWEVLRRIPYGETRSYGWVAKEMGRASAVRAVGQACGANPIPLVIPCHRVVGSSGALTGFSSGLDLKKRLLDLETGA